jgi:acyl-coenzyme A thioesterase 13
MRAAMIETMRKRFEEVLRAGLRFDAPFAAMELVAVEEGHVQMRLAVDERVQNLNGKLHGGASATLVDIAGTLAIMTADRDGRAGVSTDLNVSYVAPGEGVVLIDARVIKSGRTLAFVAVDIRRESDGVLVAQGRMTKAMG